MTSVPRPVRTPIERPVASRAARAVAAAALAAGFLVGVVPASPAAAATVQVKAPTDGRDATAAILQQVKSAPDGSTLTFVAGARYRIDKGLRISNRRNLTFDGNGATFYTDSASAPQIWHFFGGSNITVTDMTVIGANRNFRLTGDYLAGQNYHALSFRGVAGVRVSDVQTRDTFGDGLCLCPLSGGMNSDVHVSNFRFERAGRHGIAIVSARRVLIENGYVGEANVGAFQLEGAGTGTGQIGVTFRNNVVGPAGRQFVRLGGRAGTVTEDILVSNNRLVGMDLYTRTSDEPGTRKKNIRFTGNVSDITMRGTLSNGHRVNFVFQLSQVDGLTIRDNVQKLRSGVTFADVTNSTAVDVGANST